MFIDKQKEYSTLKKYLTALLTEQDTLTCSALAASAVFHTLSDVSWAGFYIARGQVLTLGCFCGKPACTRIPFGKGVCGYVASTKQGIALPNVEEFCGHIACDALSRSEVVLPLVNDNGDLLGVLDIDSHTVCRFDEQDLTYLSQIASLLVKSCF